MSTKSRRLLGSRDTASCMQTMRVLQSYLDGHTDQVTARRVAAHLEACRRCGLEAATYTEIKSALARRSLALDDEVLARLRGFGNNLTRTLPPEGTPGAKKPRRVWK